MFSRDSCMGTVGRALIDFEKLTFLQTPSVQHICCLPDNTHQLVSTERYYPSMALLAHDRGFCSTYAFYLPGTDYAVRRFPLSTGEVYRSFPTISYRPQVAADYSNCGLHPLMRH